MPELLLYFSTSACWLLLSGLAWRASRPVLAGGPEARMGGRQDVRITQVCDRLAVRGDGTLESVGCYDTQPYFDPLRVPPW